MNFLKSLYLTEYLVIKFATYIIINRNWNRYFRIRRQFTFVWTEHNCQSFIVGQEEVLIFFEFLCLSECVASGRWELLGLFMLIWKDCFHAMGRCWLHITALTWCCDIKPQLFACLCLSTSPLLFSLLTFQLLLNLHSFLYFTLVLRCYMTWWFKLHWAEAEFSWNTWQVL